MFLWVLNARSQGLPAERHTVQKMTNIIYFTCQRFQCFGPNIWPSTCIDTPACICTVKATHGFAARVFFFHYYTCASIYGDNRCYLAPVKHSSAFLKNESITNHIFFLHLKQINIPISSNHWNLWQNIGNIKRFQKNDMNDSMAAQHQYQHKHYCLQTGWHHSSYNFFYCSFQSRKHHWAVMAQSVCLYKREVVQLNILMYVYHSKYTPVPKTFQ